MTNTANLTFSVSRRAGGLFDSVRRLMQEMQRLGIGVTVFSVEDDCTVEDLPAWEPLKVRAFKTVGPRRFCYSPQTLAQLYEYDAHLLHSHGVWTHLSLAAHSFARRRRRPYVISAHGMLDEWAVRHSRWKKALAHWLYEGAHCRDASCLRALCVPEARAFRQYGLRNPVCVIPNGIDLPESEKQKAESGNQKPERISTFSFQLSTLAVCGRKVLLYLGRIHPKKGLANLVRAWAKVQRSEWILAIAGWDQGGHEAELEGLASELEIAWEDCRQQIGDRERQRSKVGGQTSESRTPSCIFHLPSSKPASLLFLGPQFGDAKAACYRHCDAFILPSFSEGLPMVVLEAWAYGKPVLMTPECNLPEGFAAGAAIRIESTVESITQGLREMFELSARRVPLRLDRGEGRGEVSNAVSCSALRTLGDNGRRLVEARYTWPKVAAEMKTVYDWLLGGGAKPDCIIE